MQSVNVVVLNPVFLGTFFGTSALSLVKRSDGKRQVMTDGHPLYFFKGDQYAGQLNGQGLDAFGAKWFIVSSSGKSVTGSASSSRGGYGY